MWAIVSPKSAMGAPICPESSVFSLIIAASVQRHRDYASKSLLDGMDPPTSGFRVATNGGETMIRKINWRKSLVALTALMPIALMGGCNNGLQGAFSGAALGSLAGLGIGAVTGDASRGLTTGAIIGGVGGAVIGDQNARASAYSTSGGGYGYPAQRVVERPVYVEQPVYVERQVYVERPVYVRPSPVVVYHGSRHYGHRSYRHYGHRGYHHQRHYDPCR